VLLGRVFGQRPLGWHRDGRDLAWFQTQADEKAADLRQAALNPGAFVDDVAGFLDRARRMLAEVVFQRLLVLLENAVRADPVGLTDAWQAAVEELGQVALHGATRDIGQRGDVLVG